MRTTFRFENPIPRTATPRQAAFARDLIAEIAATGYSKGDITPAEWAEAAEAHFATLCGREVSKGIDRLKALKAWAVANPATPAEAPAPRPSSRFPEVAAGRYALRDEEDGTVRFYVVDRPTEGKWEGFTFLSIMASDEEHPVRAKAEKRRVLAAIEADPEAALALFGRELGKCGVCGKLLTDENSRAIGIGPVCRSRL